MANLSTAREINVVAIGDLPTQSGIAEDDQLLVWSGNATRRVGARDLYVAGTNVEIVDGVISVTTEGGTVNLAATPGASEIVVSNTAGAGFVIGQPDTTEDTAGIVTATEYAKLLGIQEGATISNLSLTTPPVENPGIEIENSGGDGVVLPLATNSTIGLMSGADKTTLAGLSSSVAALASTTGTLTLSAGWVDFATGYAAPTCCRVGRIVVVHGLVKNGPITGQALIATLPVGFRPSAAITMLCPCAGGATRLVVNSNGNIHFSGDAIGAVTPASYQSLNMSFFVP